jgi:hypothetical protein
MAVYDVGDLTRLEITFVDGDGTPRDVATVRLFIREPRSATLTIDPEDIQHGDTGEYYYDHIWTAGGGTAIYRWEGEDVAYAVAEEGTAGIRESRV